MRRFAIVLALAVPAVAGAQQIVPSARMAATADVLGAAARGADALSVNPALLGVGDLSRWSVVTGAPTLSWHASPVSLADLSKYGGKTVPDAVKARWLAQIPANGAQHAAADLGATGVAVAWRGFAASLQAVAGATAALPHDAVATLLYGNTNPDGTPATRSFTNGNASAFDAVLVSVGGGRRVGSAHLLGSNVALYAGASLKSVLRGSYAAAWNVQGTSTAQPVTATADFPYMYSNGAPSGVGVDVGVAAVASTWTLSAAISDLVNGFHVTPSSMLASDGRASVSAGSVVATAPEVLVSSGALPAAVDAAARQKISDAVFARTLRLAGAWRSRPDLLLAADVRVGAGGGLQRLAAVSAGVGAEYDWKSWLPVRAGIRNTRDGMSSAVGAGLRRGAWELDASTGVESGVAGTAPVFGVSLSWGGPALGGSAGQ